MQDNNVSQQLSLNCLPPYSQVFAESRKVDHPRPATPQTVPDSAVAPASSFCQPLDTCQQSVAAPQSHAAPGAAGQPATAGSQQVQLCALPCSHPAGQAKTDTTDSALLARVAACAASLLAWAHLHQTRCCLAPAQAQTAPHPLLLTLLSQDWLVAGSASGVA